MTSFTSIKLYITYHLHQRATSNYALFFSMYCIYQLRTKGGKKTDINLCNVSFKEDV